MSNLAPTVPGAPNTSRRRSLDQERAKQAWACVKAVIGKGYEKEYSALARSAPADILGNGLGQSLAFWRAKSKGNEKNAHGQVFNNVSAWCKQQLNISDKHESLLDWIVNEADTDGYRRASNEAMAFLGWLKRFAEAELKQPESGGSNGE